MSKKENFNKAVFDMFGVGGVQVVTEDAPETEAPVAEQTLSTEVQTAEVAAPNAAHAAPYSLIPATFLFFLSMSYSTLSSFLVLYAQQERGVEQIAERAVDKIKLRFTVTVEE
ncbi:MAG: hypothetical protein IKL13_06915 [Clostridia bacterium]|nr:hypothetical protein [Clostridia bacterium]